MGKRWTGRIVILLLLAIVVLAPIYETFDHWDGFPGSGDDTVLNLIAAVTFCGLVFLGRCTVWLAITSKSLVRFQVLIPPFLRFTFVSCKAADESPPLRSFLILRV